MNRKGAEPAPSKCEINCFLRASIYFSHGYVISCADSTHRARAGLNSRIELRRMQFSRCGHPALGREAVSDAAATERSCSTRAILHGAALRRNALWLFRHTISTPPGRGIHLHGSPNAEPTPIAIHSSRWQRRPAPNHQKAVSVNVTGRCDYPHRPVSITKTTNQHPTTHPPPPSNSIVFPDSGTCTGTLVALMKLSVRVPAFTLPPSVAGSLAWETMTEAGLTRSLIT